MAEYISREAAVDNGYLSDWYISSVGNETPVWTDAHIDELLGDFIVIPKDTPAADVQPINQWISCKDKMPEEYKTVLVNEKNYGVMIGELEKKFSDTRYFIARKSGMILRTTEVAHWQPIPEPPKWTLDATIKHCLEVADQNETKAQKIDVQFLRTTKDKEATECRECAANHRQLAEWLANS